jgi:putative NADPH-quinone reductase
MKSRVLIVVGNSKPGSFCHALASQVEEGAVSRGAETKRIALDTLRFDPILRVGFGGDQPLEEDLVAAQEAIRWADHLVFVYPTWWGTMPALLKGFVDRVFLPGFAFQYRKGSALWDKLLKGRSAQLIVTMDSPPWYYRWLLGAPGHRAMKKGILEFCGIGPVAVKTLGGVRGSTPEKRADWLREARFLGAAA